MATVQLADIYEPITFNLAVQERAIELNRFVQSGVMQEDGRIDSMANQAGQVGELPFFHGLTNDEPDYTTDDPGTNSTPAKITSGKQVYASAHMHKSWSTMDLARELGLGDPLGAIINRVAKYWAVNNEKRLIRSTTGILLDNVGNDSSDMTHDIFIEDGNAAVDANLISADSVIDATATMGDHAELLSAIAMHSIPYVRLKKAQLITTIRDADNNVEFEVFLGKYRVVVDDSLTPRAGTTSGFVYTSVLFSAGVVAYGMGTPMTPSELERIASSGNGGGQDIIHSRRTEIIHPYGFAWDSATQAGQSSTYTELAAAAGWNRVFQERKNVGIAFLRTNG
jgi:hypothetical protein